MIFFSTLSLNLTFFLTDNSSSESSVSFFFLRLQTDALSMYIYHLVVGLVESRSPLEVAFEVASKSKSKSKSRRKSQSRRGRTFKIYLCVAFPASLFFRILIVTNPLKLASQRQSIAEQLEAKNFQSKV